MSHFTRWNTITGWVTFLTAAIVYLLTLEPTVSYWDCGEFITCAYKQQIGHPPGAPLFLMIAKVFSLCAPDPSKGAVFINATSAMASAFTILFLFWTITHFARKIVAPAKDFTTGRVISILGAGFVGALAFTFSDTFWFSAVEAEVYATSSLFTAVVFWAILKWEDAVDKPYANRWLMLIAYLMGLSIGVHLLNLLTIPALALVFYFKKYKPSWGGLVFTILISFLILAGLQYGIIAGLVRLAVDIELWFVNSLGLPYHSGIITYAIVLVGLLVTGLWLTYIKHKVVLNTILLAFSLIIIGYGSYAMIVIRANANPPLNENQPSDVFSFLSYLNRDQYGSCPLFYGAYYNAPVLEVVDGKPIYNKANGKYVVVGRKQGYVFDSRFVTFFPRMYSRDKDHISVYKEWANIKGKPVTVNKDGQQMVEYLPTFGENLTFFFRYQLGYMYVRYFMWNFAGKQNEFEGNGGILNGNWMTGFNFIDKHFLGPQDKLPMYVKENKGRNTYYLLPLILGLVGMSYQLAKSRHGFSVILFLFFMTGIAIVVFLNQSPLQPRERDYAYAGSFYAFAVWIGLGVMAIAQMLGKWLTHAFASITATVLCLLAVPVVMASQNWDDHDRSGRYTTHDVAYNYLNSCAPNAILFTNGDNDTFPLWYLQEVEGVRTDVRVVNLTLLDADWYINQQKRKIYNAGPLPVSLTSDKYLSRRRSYVYFIPKTEDYMPLKEAISFVASDDPDTKLIPEKNKVISYFPTRNFVLPVDALKVLANGTVSRGYAKPVPPNISFTIGESSVSKSELVLLDILAHNNWERPVYFVTPYDIKALGLGEYLQVEGFAYRFVPVSTKTNERFSYGRIETSILYDNLMDKFRWGNMNKPSVFIDSYNVSNFSFLRVRVLFSRLAEQLYQEGKKDSALRALNRCMELMPPNIYPHDRYSIKLIETAYTIGATTQARQMMNEYANQCFEEIRFFYAMPERLFILTKYKNMSAQNAIEQLIGIAGKYNDIGLGYELQKQYQKSIGK